MRYDLTPEERTAIQAVSTAWNRQPGTTDRADDVVLLVQRVLEAVPRLAALLAPPGANGAPPEAQR